MRRAIDIFAECSKSARDAPLILHRTLNSAFKMTQHTHRKNSLGKEVPARPTEAISYTTHHRNSDDRKLKTNRPYLHA